MTLVRSQRLARRILGVDALTRSRENLPETLDHLHEFILLSREKLKAYRLKVAACDRLESAKEYRDQALNEGQEVAAQVLFAEQKLGGFLTEQNPNSIRDELGRVKRSLPDGISFDMSSDCQALHRNPELVQQVIALAKEEERIPTRREVLREIRAAESKKRNEEIAARDPHAFDGTYDVVVIDPPWPMQKIEREVRPNQVGFDYPIISETELATLSIPFAEQCHAWLWTTHRFMPMAFRLLDAWRLHYVCTFVWHKPGGFQPVGLPQYNCEFALYARRGQPSFIELKDFPLCFQAPRRAHSEKPEEFYAMVRRVTSGRRLDMFNRRVIKGFDGWGQEAPRGSMSHG